MIRFQSGAGVVQVTTGMHTCVTITRAHDRSLADCTFHTHTDTPKGLLSQADKRNNPSRRSGPAGRFSQGVSGRRCALITIEDPLSHLVLIALALSKLLSSVWSSCHSQAPRSGALSSRTVQGNQHSLMDSSLDPVSHRLSETLPRLSSARPASTGNISKWR